MRPPRAPLAVALLAALAASALGCATILPGHDEYAFQECQRRYTQYVRWARFDDATGFVQPEAVPDFMRQTAEFGKIRFTDYRVRAMEQTSGSKATVIVTYYAYTRSSPLPIALDEAQEWERVPASRAWLVRSTFSQRELEPGEDFF
jgi:hypothetical protein